MSPMYDLDSEDRDDDMITWTAGGRSEVVVLVGGAKVYHGEVGKSERVTIAWADSDRRRGTDA